MFGQWPVALFGPVVTVVAALGAAGPVVGGARLPEVTATQPNIVIILADDERLGLTDAMPVVRSRIQQMGVAYSNYMVPTALCCPSRASLLTGNSPTGPMCGAMISWRPGAHGGQAAFVHFGNESTDTRSGSRHGRLPDRDGRQVPERLPRHRSGATGLGRVPGVHTHERLLRLHARRRCARIAAADYSTDVVAQRAVESSSRAEVRPLFLYVAPYGPHRRTRRLRVMLAAEVSSTFTPGTSAHSTRRTSATSPSGSGPSRSATWTRYGGSRAYSTEP